MEVAAAVPGSIQASGRRISSANSPGEFLNHAGPLITQALGMKVDSRAIELIIDTHASAPHLHDGPARAIEQVIAGLRTDE